MEKQMGYKIQIVGAVILLLSLISGSLIGYNGLQTRNKQFTIFSSILYPLGVATFIFCLVYPFKFKGFWFSYVLKRLGMIGWLRKFEIGQHAEGGINLILLWVSWSVYTVLIVGGVSYILNDLSTITFLIFVYSWIFASMNVHHKNLENLLDLRKLVVRNQKKKFGERIRNITRLFNKISPIFFIAGMLAYLLIATFWVEPQDNVASQCTFYVETVWENGPRFVIPFPPTWITWLQGKLSVAIFFGIVSVIAGMVITTTILLLWFDSGKVQIKLDIFDVDCLDPAEKLLNSFWLLTGAGLLMVPYMTAMSISFKEVGQFSAARWENYLSWGYVIFFVGLFFFSIVKFFSFVSRTKKPIEQQLNAELKEALEKRDKDKIDNLKAKRELLNRFKGRPTLATVLQLVQIIAIIAINLFVRLLE